MGVTRFVAGACLGAAACLWLSTTAQGQRGGPPGPPPSPRAAAPIDLTGYWVSIVSEDWRYRMTTAPKGDYAGVPMNQAARQAADAWDPARDEAAGDQCKAYGVAGGMRMPGRLHITWQDDETLKIELESGSQTRLLAFRTRSQGGDWQGASIASWDRSASVMGAGGFFLGAVARGGALKVITTNMKAGYLRRNGVPYSANTTVTEYFDRLDIPGGDSLLVVATEVVDPTFLTQPFWTSTHFKKQADASGWSPTPCASR
jgi:hypothetical protein